MKFGEFKDSNSRGVFDSNEIRILEKWAEIDTYDSYGNIVETFILEEFCDCETDGLNTIKVSKIEIMNEALNVHGINY